MEGLSEDNADCWVIDSEANQTAVKHWYEPGQSIMSDVLCGTSLRIGGKWVAAWLHAAGYTARECVRCSRALTRMNR